MARREHEPEIEAAKEYGDRLAREGIIKRGTITWDSTGITIEVTKDGNVGTCGITWADFDKEDEGYLIRWMDDLIAGL